MEDRKFSPSPGILQAFIQMETFLACQAESRSQLKASELIHIFFRRNTLKHLSMEKTKVINYVDLKDERFFKIKIRAVLCSNTVLQCLQTHLVIIFVRKAFYCRL